MSYFDRLPDCIDVNGVKIRVNTDFRVWVAFEQLMTGKTIDTQAFLSFLERAIPDKKLTGTFQEMFVALMVFFSCDECSPKTTASKGGKAKRVVDFTVDAPYIYAAFLAQYSIDLTKDTLHWWKFRALFDGLWETHRISQIMGYRSADLSTIKDKERKKFYRDMQKRFKLPDVRTPEEIEQDNIRNLEMVF